MLYPNLKFPKKSDRPFFYTNFVSTVDGKVQVKKEGYWPIGSRRDYQVLLELRSFADCLIHGGNLGREFGGITVKSLNKPAFKRMRKKLGKDPVLPYYILSARTDGLKISKTSIINPQDGIPGLVKFLQDKGYKNVLVEGGPTLLGSFLKENLIDEIFLTIAPKIYGNEKGSTLTLVEGQLFPEHAIKNLRLLSVKKFNSELYLRYRVI
ncbi:RibD family protein [Candidatus Daviesbacteria bacterium]|nr:RibD family protein [Candidatus Daviesbacteria bacterium]